MPLLCHDSSLPSKSHNIPVTYPSDWWAQHKDGPELTIYKDVDSIKAYSYFVHMMNNHWWFDTTVATFMVKVIQENEAFSVTAEEDWFVRETKICDKGGVCTPLNLIRLVETTAPDPPLPSSSDKEARFSLFIALIMIYRKVVTKARTTDHGMTVKIRMHDLFTNMPYRLASKDCLKISAFESQDSITPSYVKVLSIVDMFFHKFPNAPYASMRMATLDTRYHGCHVLTSAEEIARVMGLTVLKLMTLILTRPVAIDAAQVFKCEEEHLDLFGYFPYALDMGMMSRSPYSVKANPILWVWLHTIGVCLGLRSSADATMPGFVDITDSIETDIPVSLAPPSDDGVIDKQFHSSKEAREKYIEYTKQEALKQQKGLLNKEPAARHRASKRVCLELGKIPNDNIPECVDITDTIGTAVAVVLASSRTWEMNQCFDPSKGAREEYIAQNTGQEALIKHQKEQLNRELAAQLGEIVEEDPLAGWLTKIKEKYVAHNGLTEEQWESMKDRVIHMGKVRKGSVGECLRNFFDREVKREHSHYMRKMIIL